MSNIGNYITACLFFTLLSMVAKGQKNELGFGLGAMNYKGELAPSYNPLFSRPGGILFYRRNFSPVVSMRIGLTLGGLYANDSYSSTPVAKARQAKFSGLITEGSCMLEYNFFNYILSYLERRNVTKFSPYLTGGIALYNAQTNSNIQGLESQSNTKIAIPFGIGLKYMITDQWNLGLEAVARKTFTDRLDGVSNTVVNKKVLGDTVDNDMYYYFGFAISYTFYSVHCPGR
jgi:hypothetical protein